MRKNKEEYTTMSIKKTTKKEFLKNFKKYPSETQDEILIRLIKNEVKNG